MRKYAAQSPEIESAGIKTYMIVLILVFVVCSLLTNLYFLKAVNSISIESDLYLQLKSSSALKADIFPPTLYIVESDLLVQQIMNESDPVKRAVLLEKMERSREQYYKYFSYWDKTLTDETLHALVLSSDSNVREFYRLYDEKFLPALADNDTAAMRTITNAEMKTSFEQHRATIDSMSEIIETSNARTERNAHDYTERAQMLLIIVYAVSIVLMLFISLMILRKVTAIEKNIVTSAHETRMANEQLESIVEGLKRFKHSYDNTLASIEGYALREDLAGLNAYLEEILAEKTKNESVNYFKLNFIQNPAITGLVISKMIYAEKLDVRFVLKVRSEAADLPVKSGHLCDILGVLLDNAIEAAAESSGKEVFFKIEEFPDTYVFDIRNSVSAPPDRSRMFEKGWTTKGENRGFGLYMVRDILSRYENVILNSTFENGVFEQELILLRNFGKGAEALFTDVL